MSLVTLVSGGVDSTLISVLAKEDGVDQFPLFIDYGQLAAHREWETLCKIHERYNLPMPKRINLSDFGATISSGLTDPEKRINEDAFLPGRNMLFLLVGSSYAYQLNVKSVAVGFLNEEFHIFPDQTQKFKIAAETTIEIALGRKINILTPLAQYSKMDVLKLAAMKGITGTYSCHSGKKKFCGKCVSCMELLAAQRREV